MTAEGWPRGPVSPKEGGSPGGCDAALFIRGQDIRAGFENLETKLISKKSAGFFKVKCIMSFRLELNKTEHPSVPYAGQGYIRVLSKIHKRRKPSKTPSGPLRN